MIRAFVFDLDGTLGDMEEQGCPKIRSTLAGGRSIPNKPLHKCYPGPLLFFDVFLRLPSL
jgi:hypothetical protein